MRIRLLKAFRGYRAGELVDVPERLAARLVADGLGREAGDDLFGAPRAAERAVATPPRVEARAILEAAR